LRAGVGLPGRWRHRRTLPRADAGRHLPRMWPVPRRRPAAAPRDRDRLPGPRFGRGGGPQAADPPADGLTALALLPEMWTLMLRLEAGISVTSDGSGWGFTSGWEARPGAGDARDDDGDARPAHHHDARHAEVHVAVSSASDQPQGGRHVEEGLHDGR